MPKTTSMPKYMFTLISRPIRCSFRWKWPYYCVQFVSVRWGAGGWGKIKKCEKCEKCERYEKYEGGAAREQVIRRAGEQVKEKNKKVW